MAKVKLTNAQKDEIRRLTQLANRRIKFALKEYERSGGPVLPKEGVGDYQIIERWHPSSTPISRAVVFESEKDYRKQLNFLRSFDPKATGAGARPSISQFTLIQRDKTVQALETSFGSIVPDSVLEKIKTMSAPQLTHFWKQYKIKSAKLMLRYSSSQAMAMTLQELFPEDLAGLQTSIDIRQ